MDLFTPQIVTVIGITLAHFVWQGAAIGLATAALLATCPRAMARTRYLIAGAGLMAMTMAPLVTLGLAWRTAPATVSALPTFATNAVAQASGTDSLATATLMSWLPIAVGAWALGVLLLTTRLVVAWLRTEQVRRRDVQIVSGGLQAAVRRLAHDFGIARPIALFESPWIDVPTVIGWLQPTILLPVGALTGLSVQQIEAVLSHELAHIKRHDYLVNVLQHLAETVLFYHPAVWWLSRQIRIEREHCCDDVAVETCGNAAIYARALAALEESRQRQAAFALAATDGSLVDRVRRLVGPAHADARRPSLPIAACVAVLLTVLTLGGAQARSQDRPAVVEATQAEPARIVLPPASTVTLQAGDGTVTMSGIVALTGPGEATPSQAPSFERIDATTIQVDGVPYRRGTTEQDRPAVVEAVQMRPGGVMNLGLGSLGSTVALASPGEATPSQAPSFERIDATTVQVDGVPYRRGTAEDVRRLATKVAEQAGGAQPPLRVGGDITEPRKIRHVNPLYPQTARDAGISGVVILEAVIDPDGMPVNIRVLRSIPDLDQAAINAVREWRYTPTLLNGVPVAVMMTVTVNFSLQGPTGSLQALEARYATLQREAQALTGTPEELEARRGDVQSRMVELEQRIEAARTAAAAAPPAAVAGSVRSTSAAADILRVGGAIAEPKKIRDVKPVYPADARAAGVSGVVILEVTIDTDGHVTNPRILRSIPMLDQAAVAAVFQWQYTPPQVNGVPTPVQMTVTVNFTLD